MVSPSLIRASDGPRWSSTEALLAGPGPEYFFSWSKFLWKAVETVQPATVRQYHYIFIFGFAGSSVTDTLPTLSVFFFPRKAEHRENGVTTCSLPLLF